MRWSCPWLAPVVFSYARMHICALYFLMPVCMCVRVALEAPDAMRFFDIHCTLTWVLQKLEAIIRVSKPALGNLNCPVDLVNVSVCVPTNEVPCSAIDRLKNFACRNGPNRRIIDSISTTFQPSRMCILIGPPQSGKSTLLRAIAGRLPGECIASGTVRINGIAMSELTAGQVCEVVGYVPPTDEHVAVLTVEETINFAYECTMSRHFNKTAKIFNLPEYDPSTPKPKVLLLLQLFGLNACRRTQVGDSRVRGLSGGEKKRVTIAEQLVRNLPVRARCSQLGHRK